LVSTSTKGAVLHHWKSRFTTIFDFGDGGLRPVIFVVTGVDPSET
jgi:hypothetical protein